MPAPALFLAAAALASDLWPSLYDRVPILTVERIAVVALVVILFNGGIDIGLRRLRAVPGSGAVARRRHVPTSPSADRSQGCAQPPQPMSMPPLNRIATRATRAMRSTVRIGTWS